MYTLKLKIKTEFSKTKTISYENTYKFCVCVYKHEQSTTNLSFIFYLKTKILKLTNKESSLENLHLHLDSKP